MFVFRTLIQMFDYPWDLGDTLYHRPRLTLIQGWPLFECSFWELSRSMDLPGFSHFIDEPNCLDWSEKLDRVKINYIYFFPSLLRLSFYHRGDQIQLTSLDLQEVMLGVTHPTILFKVFANRFAVSSGKHIFSLQIKHKQVTTEKENISNSS